MEGGGLGLFDGVLLPQSGETEVTYGKSVSGYRVAWPVF